MAKQRQLHKFCYFALIRPSLEWLSRWQNDKAPVSPGLYGSLRYAANTLIYKADLVAEREGFEPPDRYRSTVFKTAAFDHSATSPLIVACRRYFMGESMKSP